MKISNREKRDWSLLIFIVPIGILLMMIAGKFAVRILPDWSVNAEMQSSLDLETAPKQQVGFIQPILPEILTPLGWFDTFLTPGSDSGGAVVFPPFIVFEPTITLSPSPTVVPSTTETPTAIVTASPPTSTNTPSTTTPTTPTKKPPVTSTPITPTATTPSPTATTPSPTATTPSPTATTPSPTATSITSTPSGVQDTNLPTGLNVGAPDGVVSSGNLLDGYFYVLDLGLASIVVNGPSDTNYDFVYYELYRPLPNDNIAMDSVILSISMDNIVFYEVFNWGDGLPDNNSNVGVISTTTGTENDNQPISSADLYGSPPLQTGILVDVDNAPSAPPIGSYQYLAIQAPVVPLSDGGLDVDSIQVTEVPIPTPTP